MAALMTAFAIGMITLVISYARHFATRANRNTSSVGGETQSCKDVTHTNTALLLLINVCATMVLGMSNTYQQIATSLRIRDLKHALSVFGDSRVGTNSPFSIKHKKDGRKRAWTAWLLLVITSMPVHFLANSLIGPSYTQELPKRVEYHTVANPGNYTQIKAYLQVGDERVNSDMSFPCWSAFRTGTPHYPKSTMVLENDYGIFSAKQNKFDATWNRMVVHYAPDKCTKYKEDSRNADLDFLENTHETNLSSWVYSKGDCEMGTDIVCTLHEPGDAKCRLNVRMSAAFTLMACLVIKAIYMCAVNLVARGKLKQHCLTFGDVLVASASDPELRVQGYALLPLTLS
jgi:hypothetical protein